MSNWLVPCPSCARHVNANTQCPFCGMHVVAAEPPTTINARVHRAAMIGLGLAVSLTTACAVAPPYGVSVDTGIQPDAVSQDAGTSPASDAATD